MVDQGHDTNFAEALQFEVSLEAHSHEKECVGDEPVAYPEQR